MSLDILSTPIGMFALGATCGLLIGYLLLQPAVKSACKKAKKEFENEKAEISVELQQQLGKVRESIVQSVTAYQSVSKVIEEKLPLSAEKLEELNVSGKLPAHLTYSEESETIISSSAASQSEQENPLDVTPDIDTSADVSEPEIKEEPADDKVLEGKSTDTTEGEEGTEEKELSNGAASTNGTGART